MAVNDWIMLAVLLGTLATSWATIQVKLATLSTRLKWIETNHLPTLTRHIEGLPCQDHLEAIVSVTVRLESAVTRLEKLEQRLNGA